MSSLSNTWPKSLLALPCAAVLVVAAYFAAESFDFWDDEALVGAEQARSSECDDANATMARVKKGEDVPSDMMSRTQAEYVLTTMSCPKAAQ